MNTWCKSGLLATAILFQSTQIFAQSSDVIDPNVIAQADEGVDYYGSKNQEASFSLQSYTFFGKSNGVPSQMTIENDVKTKVKYIFGYMRRSATPAGINPKYKITTLKIETTDTKYKVYYQISGKGVFTSGLNSYTFLIPISHSTIYERSQGLCSIADGDKIDASIFWYHWFPAVPGCPLVENVDYIKYSSVLTPLANTTSTYPEYNRLFSTGSLNISMFFGITNYADTNWNPNTSQSTVAKNYAHQRNRLVNIYKMQSRVWSENEVRQYYNPPVGKPIPYIEEFTKITPKGPVNFRFFFGNTGLAHDSKAFHIFLKSALATSQVVMYDGHSGI
jgi:hypothetical protein